jgi:hypothetical protein
MKNANRFCNRTQRSKVEENNLRMLPASRFPYVPLQLTMIRQFCETLVVGQRRGFGIVDQSQRHPGRPNYAQAGLRIFNCFSVREGVA